MKTSGKTRQFPTGSQRDSSENKPRMELLPYDILMERIAPLYASGAAAYGDNDWRKGQPSSAVFGSLMRHLTKWQKGERDEDHLAAVVWNALALINNEMYHSENFLINDMEDWVDEDGTPTGKGSYIQKMKEETKI